MSGGSIRRAQLVSPFGVGAMSILVDGTSVITAGLDHWFTVDDPARLMLHEYQAQDWRLEQRLQVREFRLPPDFRIRQRGSVTPNSNLKVPVLRFPRLNGCRPFFVTTGCLTSLRTSCTLSLGRHPAR